MITKRFVKWLRPAAGVFLLPLALMAQSPSPASSEGHTGNDKRQSPEARFTRMDKNSDGFVTADEARNPERYQRLLAKADNSPKDGKISKDEFMKVRTPGGPYGHKGKQASTASDKSSGDGQHQREERFTRMDKNRDGFVTADEARNPEQFKRLSAKADNNPKDGKISRDEFVKAGAPKSEQSQSSPGEAVAPSPK
jgi:Ca2+-binding EF-hand superfamily protein